MEVKLNFKDFKKIICLDTENININCIFSKLTKHVSENVNSGSSFELFWKDNVGDFVLFKTPDEFAEILKLKKPLNIFVVEKHHLVGEMNKCEMCNEMHRSSNLHICLNCNYNTICGSCFSKHEGGSNEGHFGILIKSLDFFQIHPYLFKQVKDFNANLKDFNILNIGIFFQKVLGKHGYGVSESFGVSEEMIQSTHRRLSVKETNELMQSLNYKNLSPLFEDKVDINEKFEENSAKLSVNEALDRMLNMGYINNEDILRKVIEKFDGNIPMVIDWFNRETLRNS